MSNDDVRKRDGAPLTGKLLNSIAQHLNQEHQEDLLACAKALASLDWAEQARVTHVDASSITLEARNSSHTESVRLDFPTTAKGVLAFKRILGEKIAESRSKLGWNASVDDH
jgi:hypothetical protein